MPPSAGRATILPFEPGARWTLQHIRALFTDPVIYTRILPDTFIFVAGTVAVVFAIGFGLAWLIERTDLPGREIWFALILFPLLVPTPVLAIAWIFLMGPNAGWLNLAIRATLGLDGSGPINIFSMGGLILCQALASAPFVFLLLSADAAHHGPGAGRSERHLRRVAARPLFAGSRSRFCCRACWHR